MTRTFVFFLWQYMVHVVADHEAFYDVARGVADHFLFQHSLLIRNE